MKRTLPALLPVLLLGVLCIRFAADFLFSLGVPPLVIAFSRESTLVFRNVGKSDVSLDAGGLDAFLFHPVNGGTKHILQLRSKPFGPDQAENARRLLSMKKLAPGESAALLNIRPHIAAMPRSAAENRTLTAVYSPPPDQRGGALWTGEIKSLPLVVTE